jgi:peroxiredoxin
VYCSAAAAFSLSLCLATSSRPKRVPDKKQIRRIVLKESEPHESGHYSGALFPDYELTDQTGKHRKLSDLQGPDPMILVLSRGGYCPKDPRQAEGLVQLHHEMEVGYSRLVTISTDNMLLTNENRDGVGAHWTFLSDPGRKVQKNLDIAEYTDPRAQSNDPTCHCP